MPDVGVLGEQIQRSAPVEFARRRSVEEAADCLGRDSEWIDVEETHTTTIYGLHDLGDIDALRGAVALFHSQGLL